MLFGERGAPVLVLLHRAGLPLVEEEEDEHEVHDEPGDAEPGGEWIGFGERLRNNPLVFAEFVHLSWLGLRVFLVRGYRVQQVAAGSSNWKDKGKL